MIEDTVNREDTGRLYPTGSIEFFQRSPHSFVHRMRRNIHQAGNLFGIFVLINVSQRFNLRDRQQADVIVGIAVHGV